MRFGAVLVQNRMFQFLRCGASRFAGLVGFLCCGASRFSVRFGAGLEFDNIKNNKKFIFIFTLINLNFNYIKNINKVCKVST